MSDRLPPLTALRAFEAAARHMSFALAAAELNVTPAALSFQIKSLEDHLGQPVFHRLNRAVALTDIGEALRPGLVDGFAALNGAWRAAQRAANDSHLSITAGPAFTAKWLAPRLFDFAQNHPEIELRFAATLRLMDFDRDDVDIAVRFGRGDDDGLYSRDLVREWLTPMMSPALAAQIKTPEDLVKYPLIHQDTFPFQETIITWDNWFRAMGLGAPPTGGARFSQADHAHDAAVSGSGVVFGRYSLTETALRDGLLVAPFRMAIVLPYRYRLVMSHTARHKPQHQAFENWITAEAAAMATRAEHHDFIRLEDLDND